MKCSICKKKIDKLYTAEGEMYWDLGHNAEPINSGRCCSKCNDEIVTPKRLTIAGVDPNDPRYFIAKFPTELIKEK